MKSEAPSQGEIVNAMRRCWQPVARVADLREGPRQALILGEALTVFLTEEGEPAVLADRCPHRGASLSMGTVVGNAVQCPYHGWEWSGDGGRCTRIPSLENQRQIPPGARVAAYPVREQWGLVWSALEEPLGEPPTIPWFDGCGKWALSHGEPFELPVSFGVMIENFRDVAHLAFVHRGTLGAMPETVEPLKPERDGRRASMRREMRTGDGAEEIWGSIREIRYHLTAPNFTAVQMLTDSGERCLLHASRAIGPAESAHYWIEGARGKLEEASLEEAVAAETRIYAEDVKIISAVTPRELSLDPSEDLSTLADAYTLAYREAFAVFVRNALALSP